ncbi:pyridoxal phosphate-dependent transferase [Coniochaeta sp. 2T2.1]|nr:pyridoxal phosphate-dependent transferase [Coniochaeta sp. 2T2.1]
MAIWSWTPSTQSPVTTTDAAFEKSGDSRYNVNVERLRHEEYPMLEGSIYLDHAGTTPYPKSLMDEFAKDMTANLFGNPHSASSSSQLSTSRIEDTRLRVLQWFNADPAEFDVVFVANATAGVKLVVEALRAVPGGFDYLYHEACHTSLIGAREEALSSVCFGDSDVDTLFARPRTCDQALVAYPAQSNMDGQRLPLSWSHQVRQGWLSTSAKLYTLLDAAALAATSPLNLSDSEIAPDFLVVSFYKIFGFPDLGALIVRRQAESVFDSRRYFGGGTVDMVVCRKEQWHAPKRQFLHDRIEDGTLPVHSIIALDLAMTAHRKLFGPMDKVAAHTSFLAERLDLGLRTLKHGSGTDVCTVYSSDRTGCEGSAESGPVVAFNIRNQYGAWISLAEFEKLATLKSFHVRTGGVCNPGGIASALGLEPWEMKQNFSSGFRCGTDNDVMAGKPTGIIRASLGAMSTIDDVDQFVVFVDEFYRDTAPAPVLHRPISRAAAAIASDLYVESIVVYPIKSCGGYKIPRGTKWEVRPEGLAWDREWCLMHRGTGQALSQKGHPKMALLRPSLDFKRGELCVRYAGKVPPTADIDISVPLSNNPAFLQPALPQRSRSSRVCGDEISAQTYTADTINNFFSDVLGVPCVLARFPPGGQGKSMRHSKAHLQKHQMSRKSNSASLPGSFPGPPSPPDSDTEATRRPILLSNESPILAINMSSLAVLNREIVSKGGKEVSPDVFRANVVIGSERSGSALGAAYAEDNWSTLRIGQQDFKMLGSCRRCHMVSINQDTAEKSEEPFVTLSKTRRFDGKVFFGTHMGHAPPSIVGARETQYRTIKVGDTVVPDVEDEV